MTRIGVDFGGTKIEAAALDDSGAVIARRRVPNPGGYDAAISAVVGLVEAIEAEAGSVARLGVGVPGSVSPKTGMMRNANSQWLNGRAFGPDLEAALGKPVRLTNDANCLALSEAVDGGAAGAPTAFAAILGTGCGGGVVVNGKILEGANGIGGEWGHNPLPWPSVEEISAPNCWCGRQGCMETWVSGSGFEAEFARVTGEARKAPAIVAAAHAGEPAAVAALDRYVDRLARGLAAVCNLIDPDVIVLGGGMSNLTELYQRLPAAVAHYIFSDVFETRIAQAVHGDSSGVRGAAWLWDGP